MIEMQDVWKTYPNGTHALQGVSVKIDRNEFVYVVEYLPARVNLLL